MSTMSGSIEDVRKRPNKLSNTSEHKHKHSKRKSRQHSPGRPGEEPDEPDDEAVIPGNPQNDQECPRSVRNQRVDETDAPGRDRAPGGHRGEQEASRAAKGDPDRINVVDCPEHDWMCPRADGNEHEVETNT